jgi:hypothetical protein
MTAESRLLNGRYRLICPLGSGGMGSVWLAEDQLLERSVALKALISDGAAHDLSERRARALKEARALARVRHPAIVSIHDVFFVHASPWIVMEHVSGRSLGEIIAGQPMEERSLARIGLHVLQGLVAVHRAGVVHRDVKPANILVADDGSIRLVDFGIARISGDESLTGHRIVGTPDFLAPERFRRDQAVGPAADIWALGVTFYYALEGYSPFRQDNERGWEATMGAILNENPRPLTRRGRLAGITLRMLDKEPVTRADAAQVIAVLKAILGSPDMPAPPGPAVHSPPSAQPKLLPARPPQRDRQVRDRQVDGGREPMLEEARAVIGDVGSDASVAMLLAMRPAHVARVLADCPPRQRGELLEGIAGARPGSAGPVLRMLDPAAASRAVEYLQPETAAGLLVSLMPAEAGRILDRADKRTVAAIVMQLGPRDCVGLLRSMPRRQRAAQALSHVRPAKAAAVLRADPEFAAVMLRELSEPLRRQLNRHLSPSG